MTDELAHLTNTISLLLSLKQKAKIEVNLDGSGEASHIKFNFIAFDLNAEVIEKVCTQRDRVGGHSVGP